MTPLPDLAHEAERLRFRAMWHLPVDGQRVRDVQTELVTRAPWHPIARNIRAAEALPETELPAPGLALAEAARHFARGDLEAALAAVRDDPRASDTRARLLLALGRPDGAAPHAERAVQGLGQLPSLLALRARILLEQGRAADAWRDAVAALTTNPLHGTAAVVHQAAAAATGRSLRAHPLRAPVSLVGGELTFLGTPGSRSEAAWRAWHDAAAEPSEGPPGAGKHRALLAAWRAAPTKERLDETEDVIRCLDEWDRRGLLPAYEWSAGLQPGNAQAFRTWNASGHGDLRRFWAEALLR